MPLSDVVVSVDDDDDNNRLNLWRCRPVEKEDVGKERNAAFRTIVNQLTFVTIMSAIDVSSKFVQTKSSSTWLEKHVE